MKEQQKLLIDTSSVAIENESPFIETLNQSYSY